MFIRDLHMSTSCCVTRFSRSSTPTLERRSTQPLLITGCVVYTLKLRAGRGWGGECNEWHEDAQAWMGRAGHCCCSCPSVGQAPMRTHPHAQRDTTHHHARMHACNSCMRAASACTQARPHPNPISCVGCARGRACMQLCATLPRTTMRTHACTHACCCHCPLHAYTHARTHARAAPLKTP